MITEYVTFLVAGRRGKLVFSYEPSPDCIEITTEQADAMRAVIDDDDHDKLAELIEQATTEQNGRQQ